MKKNFLSFLVLLLVQLIVYSSFAQLDSIYEQGVYRTFIVHLPTGYNSNNQYPLVINLHGLNSSAAQQEAYSQFDIIADTENFIVVYPNAVGGSWPINGTSGTDAVNFISHLIDTIQTDYSCNSCLFITGMSNGGFFTYYLACNLLKPITAIAVVSGNMQQVLENNCAITNGLPVMHFHGTSDNIVNYNGTIGIPPVDTTILWWVNANNCSATPINTSISDTNLGDSCNVEKYYYGGGVNGSEMTFYKIINGGHTWPGAAPIQVFGNTNQDINASALIGSFFQSFCSISVGTKDTKEEDRVSISVFPNPAQQTLTVQMPQQFFEVTIYTVTGNNIFMQRNITNKIQIDCSNFKNGVYFLQIANDNNIFTKKIILSR